MFILVPTSTCPLLYHLPCHLCWSFASYNVFCLCCRAGAQIRSNKEVACCSGLVEGLGLHFCLEGEPWDDGERRGRSWNGHAAGGGATLALVELLRCSVVCGTVASQVLGRVGHAVYDMSCVMCMSHLASTRHARPAGAARRRPMPKPVSAVLLCA